MAMFKKAGSIALLILCAYVLLTEALPLMSRRRRHGLRSAAVRQSPQQRRRNSERMSSVSGKQTLWFDQDVSHFDYVERPTWKQRYLYDDQYWGNSTASADRVKSWSVDGCRGPILFYTGNESPITDYWRASGFQEKVLAPKFGALLVFAEHRYFGESLPFGKDSFKPGKIDFLSAEQALADYAVLIRHIKKTVPGAATCPVLAFGGSYGGMLTAWFRRLYPNVVLGGLAASAPFGFVGTGVSPSAFNLAASHTYSTATPNCGPLITDSFKQLAQLIKTTEGRAHISRNFGLCSPIKTEADGQNVINFVDAGLIDACMLDYPYPTDYGIQLGAWPVNNTCVTLEKTFAETKDYVTAIGRAMSVFYNATGSLKCFDMAADGPDFGKGDGWPYLACTELYLPDQGAGIFPHSPWSVNADAASCKAQFNVQLRPEWARTHFGGLDWDPASVSNIIFSNGLLDPWHAQGVLKSLSPTLVAVVIPEAAHHLDLRGPNPDDPPYVRAARKEEEAHLTAWLQKHAKQEQLKQQQRRAR